MSMIYDTIADDICRQMSFAPTDDQRAAAVAFGEYLQDERTYSLFVLRGYAGTGKTTLLNAITRVMERQGMLVELMATTGRAAKVLSAVSGRMATTIHRRIYRASSLGIEEGGDYRLGSPSGRPTLFVVDEASMISTHSSEPTPFGSGNLLDDLLSYVWSCEGSRLIVVGDTAQLPPVGSDLSEALDLGVLADRYGLRVYTSELTEVVRQRSESGILYHATALRNLIGAYSDATEGEPIPIALHLESHPDVRAISGADFVDAIDSAYRRYGRHEVLVVCPSNKRALHFNLGIRTRVLDYEDELVRGERLIVARNNYFHAKRPDRADFIANGEMIEVRHTYRHYYIYDLHFVDATVYLPDRDQDLDVRLLLSSLTDEQAQRSYDQRLALYNALVLDYSQDPSIADVRRAIRNDPYWGALEVKYGYAVTAHKAQGGQWGCVFVDLGLVSYLPNDRNMARWLYTALTRASECVYLVNPPESLIGMRVDDL